MKITILVGYSASGKSTLANRMVSNNPNNIIVNRDKLREMLFGYSESTIQDYYNESKDLMQTRENLVTEAKNNLIETYLNLGKDVIIDDTNLDKKYIKEIQKKFYYSTIELIDVPSITNISKDEAIINDSNRTKIVGQKVINFQYDRYINLKAYILSFKHVTPKLVLDNSLTTKNGTIKPKCIVVDIDGTIADKNNRNAFDFNKVIEDLPRQNIIDISNKLFKDYRIILCSGREEICREDTIKWLNNNNVFYSQLLMRGKGDFRPDWVIKQEFWEAITNDYYIVGCLDDRNQVILRGRQLGLDMLQVNYGNF